MQAIKAINLEYLPRIKLLGFVAYATPWVHFKRITDEYILYFIKSGELHIEENGVRYALKKGDFLLLEPHLEHVGVEKSACDYYYIHFEHPDIRQQPAQDFMALAMQLFLEENVQDFDPHQTLCCLPKQFALPSKAAFQQTVHSLNELKHLYNRRQFNRSLIALKFSQFLIEASREYIMQEFQQNTLSHHKSMMKVHAILEYIHQHYSGKITGADVEREFAGNFDYMNRIFHKFTGHTITRYVNMVRINHAKELIEATPLSFGEIGYLVGLNDPYYFSKVFKQYAGVSPREYEYQVKRGRF